MLPKRTLTLRDRVHGHFWTVAPRLDVRMRHEELSLPERVAVHFDAAGIGPVRLSAELYRRSETDLVVLVHGLGGSIASPYMPPAAAIAMELGASVLLVNLRGADLSGDDIYHAGLTEDLSQLLTAPALGNFSRVGIVGFSMGGHVTLRWALAPSDARVMRVASVCAPLDLAASCQTIDRTRALLYRRHALGGLKRIYERVAARGRGATPWEVVARAGRIRQWDELTVVPRFGFASADAYYAEMSAGPRLSDVRIPSLVLVAPEDPMVTFETLLPSLQAARGLAEVRLRRGGHVSFSPRIDGVREAIAFVLDGAV